MIVCLCSDCLHYVSVPKLTISATLHFKMYKYKNEFLEKHVIIYEIQTLETVPCVIP